MYEPQVKKQRIMDNDEESNSSQDLQPRRSARQTESYEQQIKKSHLIDHDEESNSSQDLQPRRSARQTVEVKDDEKGVLRECLFYIQKHLQRYGILFL